MIRQASSADADGVCRIYNHYVQNTTVTFEQAPVSYSDMAARIAEVSAASLPWLVAERNGSIVGFCYASKWKVRAAYRYAVETTVYLAPDVLRTGIGTALYEELIGRLKDRGMHVAIGGIALPNEASIRLHEKLGFRKVAEFFEVGFKFDKWVSVGYWEIRL